jgi:hypothetical protein
MWGLDCNSIAFLARLIYFVDRVIRLSPKRGLTPKAAEVPWFLDREQSANA